MKLRVCWHSHIRQFQDRLTHKNNNSAKKIKSKSKNKFSQKFGILNLKSMFSFNMNKSSYAWSNLINLKTVLFQHYFVNKNFYDEYWELLAKMLMSPPTITYTL